MDETGIIARAHQAERLLKDPLLREAFDMVLAALHTAWENSPARDVDGREQLWQRIKATKDARGYLEQAVNDGKVTLHSMELREQEKRRNSLFSFKGRA
jgi:hypothetical protein